MNEEDSGGLCSKERILTTSCTPSPLELAGGVCVLGEWGAQSLSPNRASSSWLSQIPSRPLNN